MGRGSSKAGGGGGSNGKVGGGGNVAMTNAVGTAYNDIMDGNATMQSLTRLQSVMNIDQATFTTNWNSVKQQNVTIKDGDKTINLTFNSTFEPTQTGTPKKAIKTEVTARLWENGNIKAIRTIAGKSSKSLKNAATQYADMLKEWKSLTGQTSISF